MLYDGKRPQDMTTQELSDAIQYVATHMLKLEQNYALNEAAAIELADELKKRSLN